MVRVALFAALYLILSSLQPGLFTAVNAGGFLADGAMAMTMQQPAALDSGADHAGHGVQHAKHEASKGDSQNDAEHHHKPADTNNKSCEIHCAPVLAVPVECPGLKRPLERCFAPVVAKRLPLDNYAEFIRPPETLI